MAAASWAFLLLLALAFGTVSFVYAMSLEMHFLQADESNAYGVYTEGDTAIIVCRAEDTLNGGPFNVAQFEWLRHGSNEKVQIADKDQITFFDARNRFSGANLTYIAAENKTDYRITVSNLDRYDNGNRFFCRIGKENVGPSSVTFTRSLANQMKVKWDPPSAQCSSSVNITKSKKGEEVSYSCSVMDTDRKSSGRISIQKNDVTLQGLMKVKASLSGFEYYTSYSTQVTDDSVNDVYTCRYAATGGFEEYSSDCTFDRPSCVVEDFADECSGAVTSLSRGHIPAIAIVVINCVLVAAELFRWF